MNEMKSQSESTVLVHRHPRMVSIVLNRPRVLNSLNLEMIRFIDRALDEIEADQNMQFILLSGAGERGFCAGGDIKALAQAVLYRPDGGDASRIHQLPFEQGMVCFTGGGDPGGGR